MTYSNKYTLILGIGAILAIVLIAYVIYAYYLAPLKPAYKTPSITPSINTPAPFISEFPTINPELSRTPSPTIKVSPTPTITRIPTPTPTRVPTSKPSPTPTPAPVDQFTIEADDSGFYIGGQPVSTIYVNNNAIVKITFVVRSENVYHNGLEFRGCGKSVGALPGGSALMQVTISYTCGITAYWPNTNISKGTLTVNTKL